MHRVNSDISENGHPVDVLKSGLQKSIRRGLHKTALFCAQELIQMSSLFVSHNLRNRLFMIMAEDIGVGATRCTYMKVYALLNAWDDTPYMEVASLEKAICLMAACPKSRNTAEIKHYHSIVNTQGHDYSARTNFTNEYVMPGDHEEVAMLVNQIEAWLKDEDDGVVHWIQRLLACREKSARRGRRSLKVHIIFDMLMDLFPTHTDIVGIHRHWFKLSSSTTAAYFVINAARMCMHRKKIEEQAEVALLPIEWDPSIVPILPDYVYDKHTAIGRSLCRSYEHFNLEGTVIRPVSSAHEIKYEQYYRKGRRMTEAVHDIVHGEKSTNFQSRPTCFTAPLLELAPFVPTERTSRARRGQVMFDDDDSSGEIIVQMEEPEQEDDDDASTQTQTQTQQGLFVLPTSRDAEVKDDVAAMKHKYELHEEARRSLKRGHEHVEVKEDGYVENAEDAEDEDEGRPSKRRMPYQSQLQKLSSTLRHMSVNELLGVPFGDSVDHLLTCEETRGDRPMTFYTRDKSMVFKEMDLSTRYGVDAILCNDIKKGMSGFESVHDMYRVRSDYKIVRDDKSNRSWRENTRWVKAETIYLVMTAFPHVGSVRENPPRCSIDMEKLARIIMLKEVLRIPENNTRNVLVDADGRMLSIEEFNVGSSSKSSSSFDEELDEAIRVAMSCEKFEETIDAAPFEHARLVMPTRLMLKSVGELYRDDH